VTDGSSRRAGGGQEHRSRSRAATTSGEHLDGRSRREWDGSAADARVRAWADAQDGANAKYRDAHVWYDDEKPDNFGSYKLLIADVIGGKLTAVRGDGGGRGP